MTLSDDPCTTVLVLLRFRPDQGFNMSYQWPAESVLRLKNQKNVGIGDLVAHDDGVHQADPLGGWGCISADGA